MFGRKARLPIDIDLRIESPEIAQEKFSILDEPDYEESSEKLRNKLAEARKNISIAQQKQKEEYDKKHAKPEKFEVGKRVLKKDTMRRKRKGDKLYFNFTGPYTIVKAIPCAIY